MGKELFAVTGCMLSGKTSELQRQIKRATIAGAIAQTFKPKIDNRWGKTNQIVSHDGNECPAIPVENPIKILECLEQNTNLVAIDEVQFFGPEIVPVIQQLLENNIRVLVAGLPQDFRGEPFGSMPILLALADQITLLTAICTYQEDDGTTCGRPATKTQRLVNGQPADYNNPVVLIGGQESYEARCPDHHLVPGKPKILFSSSKDL